MSKLKHISRKRKVFMIIIVAILLAVLVDASCIYDYSKEDETRSADAAIVLGASISGDEPSPVFATRIEHGIWLYMEGYVDVLIFTGGYGEGLAYSEAGVAKNYAIAAGVPTEDILIEEKSTITQENLSYAKELMDQQEIESALIVSDPLHMKRSMRMAKDLGIEAFTSPVPNSKYQSFRTKSTFLMREVFFDMGYLVYRIFK